MAFTYINKISQGPARSYMATTKAAIGFVQELKHKRQKFFDAKDRFMAVTYMNRQDGDEDQTWRMEGLPRIDGLGGRDSGGTAHRYDHSEIGGSHGR